MRAYVLCLLTGAGKDFCSGMDLRVFGNDVSDDVAKFQAEARNMAGLLLDMRRHPRPIVAAVEGRALGGGCGIATAADIVLAAESAQFGYPEINIGFVPAIVISDFAAAGIGEAGFRIDRLG